MSTATAKSAPPRSNTTADPVRELIRRAREERSSKRSAAPAGDPSDLELQHELLLDLLARGIAHERERHPEQPMRYSVDRGQMVPDGPAPPPFDALENPVLRGIALWIGNLEEWLAAKGARGDGR